MENYCDRNAIAEQARIQDFNLGRGGVNRGPKCRDSRPKGTRAGVRFLGRSRMVNGFYHILSTQNTLS